MVSPDTTEVHPQRPVLLAIVGTGQNGATLLCRMLGELPGFVGVGEIGRLWDTSLIENRDCWCGVPFARSPFWIGVGDAGFGGWDNVDGFEVSRLRELPYQAATGVASSDLDIRGIHARSARHLVPVRLAARASSEYGRNLRRFAQLMRSLYEAIAQVAGARVVVDSMKFPYHARMLPYVPAVDLRFVHLVRDSRGVAHSQTKTIMKQGTSQTLPAPAPPPQDRAQVGGFGEPVELTP